MRGRVFVVLAGLLGCSSDGDDSTAATTTTVTVTAPSSTPARDLPSGLRPRTFRADRAQGWELSDPGAVWIFFDSGELRASGGCNTISGDWTVDGERLVADGLAMTEMACMDEGLMAQDQRLVELLSAGPTLVLDAAHLTVAAGDVVLEMTEAPG